MLNLYELIVVLEYDRDYSINFYDTNYHEKQTSSYQVNTMRI